MRALAGGGVCRPVLSVIAFGLVGVGGWCASAHAVFPGSNGRIALTASVFGVDPLDPSFAWIVTIRPNGEDPRVLAGVKARGPSYRPDGHMIAFSRFREIRRGGEVLPRSRGIYLMRADGTAKHRLIRCRCSVPAWGPDRRLVFQQDTRPSRIVLFRQGRLRVLARGQSPAWSPDGRWIAFTRNDRPQPEGFSLASVYVMRPDGSRIRRLALGASPDWTPNGERIVFRGERPRNLILSVRPNGSGLRRIAVFRSRDPQNSTPLLPTNAPDGRLIAFSKRFADDPNWIWLMRADGSERRRIFNPNRWATSGGLPERLIGFSSVFPTGIDWRPLPRPRPTP
jgi:hypothetical protein